MNIPRLGIAMTEGTLVTWLVSDGDHVDHGMSIYVLETEKVENEVQAASTGTIHLLGEVGSTYAVGTTIAEIES